MVNRINTEINYTKGILVISMVYAHVFQFQFLGRSYVLKAISIFTNLVSFSGFLFCFGFAFWLAYLSKPKIPWKAIIKTSLKCYFSFFLSGVAYRLMVSGNDLSFSLLSRIAALRDIPGFSEFLISFSVVTIVSCLLAPVIEVATRNRKNLAVATALLLTSTLLPKSTVYDPLIGLFIGGSGFKFFPLVQYMPLFLFGIYTARSQRRFNIFALAAAVIAVSAFAGLNIVRIPIHRFPPSAIWIVCSAGLVYIYYGLGKVIAKFFPFRIKIYINSVGQNVLFYLLLSNIFLFANKALGYGRNLTIKQNIASYLAIMMILFFLQYISTDFQRSKQAVR